MKSALTIAGLDPSGGAGLQADLRVFAAFGIHGYSAASAITAQNTRGVERAEAVEESLLRDQLRCLLSDVKPDAVKTGMLYTPHAVRVVSEMVKKYSLKNLVVDPVTVSSTGVSLAGEGTLDEIRERLLPLSVVVTPNIYEAHLLTGMTVEDEDGMAKAARKLKKMGPKAVIVTGGHLRDIALDVFYDGKEMRLLRNLKVKGEYHGTGCAFSATLAALLALGRKPREAAEEAKSFVAGAVSNAFHPGGGMWLLRFKGEGYGQG